MNLKEELDSIAIDYHEKVKMSVWDFRSFLSLVAREKELKQAEVRKALFDEFANTRHKKRLHL